MINHFESNFQSKMTINSRYNDNLLQIIKAYYFTKSFVIKINVLFILLNMIYTDILTLKRRHINIITRTIYCDTIVYGLIKILLNNKNS